MDAKTMNAPQNPPVQSHQGTATILDIDGHGELENTPKVTKATPPTRNETMAAKIGLPAILARAELAVAWYGKKAPPRRGNKV